MVTCWEEELEITPASRREESGRAAFLSLQRAAEDLKAGLMDAVVTAPIDKDNIQADGFTFPGHTEFFTSLTSKGTQSLMLLVSRDLRVATVTGHIPLKEWPDASTPELIRQKIMVLLGSLQQRLRDPEAALALLGLNPHAGEGGLLGTEEEEMLQPLVQALKDEGHLVYGPYPADGFFATCAYRKFDATLAMYHDQGLMPFKTLAFDTGVNFTAGFPLSALRPTMAPPTTCGKGMASESLSARRFCRLRYSQEPPRHAVLLRRPMPVTPA